uniref:Uncharacterized protein n=1 Tax=Ditylenchus dipsaci TaxID=166011 RepID=A0A915DS92_9BILA
MNQFSLWIGEVDGLQLAGRLLGVGEWSDWKHAPTLPQPHRHPQQQQQQSPGVAAISLERMQERIAERREVPFLVGKTKKNPPPSATNQNFGGEKFWL